jgi:hypothetical protein
MTTVFVLLVGFLGIGLCSQTYTTRSRMLIGGAIVAMLIYLYLT